MNILKNITNLNTIKNISFSGEKTQSTHKNNGDSQIKDEAKLLENTLEGLAISSKVAITPSLNQTELSENEFAQKARLEEKGLNVSINNDGKFIVESTTAENVFIGTADINNVATLKGNFTIYNDTPQSDININNLEYVEGDLSISGFDDECRTSGSPNWGYACSVKFPNLKEVAGDLNIYDSACYLDLNSLEKVGGSLDIKSSCKSDNKVYLKNIESINGDFNIQGGSVSSSTQIFGAVEGTMNAIPPKSQYTNGFGTCLIIGEQPSEKYYKFTTEAGVIKKFNL